MDRRPLGTPNDLVIAKVLVRGLLGAVQDLQER